MKGLDARSLPGAARWGGAGAESPRSATQASSTGYFLGPLIFPQELAKPAFSSRFVPSWFIYCIRLLFSLARRSARGCATGLESRRLLSPPGNPATCAFSWVLRSKYGGERVFFGNREPIWWPWSQDQWLGPPVGLQVQFGCRAPLSKPCFPGLPGSSSSLPYPQSRV